MPKEINIEEDEKNLSKFFAMVVRNAMEDFHTKHLSDDQMKELNPIIRNALYTALHSMRNQKDKKASEEYIKYHLKMIPDYWEEPELLKGYVSMMQKEARSD